MWISTLDNKTFTNAVIDEGAEICAIDKSFALKSGIKFEKSSCNAVAAGNSKMNVVGQTTSPNLFNVHGTRVPVILTLTEIVVIDNLGTDLLIGQPGKIENKIVVYPHKFQIHFENIVGAKVPFPLKKSDIDPFVVWKQNENFCLPTRP